MRATRRERHANDQSDCRHRGPDVHRGLQQQHQQRSGTEPPSASTSVAPGSVGDFRQNVGDRVYFDTDMSSIREDGRNTLAKQAEWLKKYTNYPITIEGKCDERGTREYNLALGERRANAARQYLVAQGIPASRIKTISYGKERPEAVGSDEGAWARNRVAITALE